MIPDHCKKVSVKEVDFALTKDNIYNTLIGSKLYLATKYLILKNDRDIAVVEVSLKNASKYEKSLFREVIEVKIISLPEETIFIEDPEVDVLNKNMLLAKAKEYKEKTVVVQGEFEHISFVSGRDSIKLYAIDVVPPYPAKLVKLVEKALKVSSNKIPIEVIPVLIDLKELSSSAKSDSVVFPCNASGISISKNLYFLDKTPNLNPEEVTLVGCNLSKKIFKEVYGIYPDFIQMCPRELTKHYEDFFIAKCCEVTQGFEIRNKGVIVPWGAEIKEVVSAIEYICQVSFDCRLQNAECGINPQSANPKSTIRNPKSNGRNNIWK